LQHRVDLKEPDVSGGIYRLRLGAWNIHKSTAYSSTLMDTIRSSGRLDCRRATQCHVQREPQMQQKFFRWEEVIFFVHPVVVIVKSAQFW
jgi:hypothetical protein